MPETDPTAVTAYHEAGHAVAALALGRAVQAVSVRPTEEFLGTCSFGKPLVRPSDDWLETELLISLAGPAAEAVFVGDYDPAGAAKDLAFVRKLAAQRAGGGRQIDRLERRAFAKAEHLLTREAHWRAVELIAAELLRVGRISGRAARHLFEQAMRD